jgi:hypothetical protein
MNTLNQSPRSIRRSHITMDSPSKLCENPYKVLRVTNPVSNLIDGSRINISAVKVFCEGSHAEVALMLGTPTQDKPAGTIKVGEHYAGGSKRIQLPCEGLKVSPVPLNPQDPSWGDEFSATVRVPSDLDPYPSVHSAMHSSMHAFACTLPCTAVVPFLSANVLSALSIQVEGTEVVVSRVDGGGEVWGQELELQWTRRSKVELVIGAHEGPNAKVVEMPSSFTWSDFEVSGTPLNEQQPGWTDCFSVEVSLVVLFCTSTQNIHSTFYNTTPVLPPNPPLMLQSCAYVSLINDWLTHVFII